MIHESLMQSKLGVSTLGFATYVLLCQEEYKDS
jgi:hypothetical protein